MTITGALEAKFSGPLYAAKASRYAYGNDGWNVYTIRFMDLKTERFMEYATIRVKARMTDSGVATETY